MKIEELRPIATVDPRLGSHAVAPGNRPDDPTKHGQEEFKGATDKNLRTSIH
ncbi:MAG: hypothetical protein OSB46_14420 [Alphaproteobacteria bacterium]|nr:hypothetical protein [Alphaproteobacteria bacterium]